MDGVTGPPAGSWEPVAGESHAPLVDPGLSDTVPGLVERDGRLLLPPQAGADPVPVTVRWLRPLTARSEIVFLDEKGREVLTARGVEAVADELRPAVERALRERYVLPVIERVRRIEVRAGTRYWEVETDLGPRWFALKEPGKNVTWLSERRLVLRDTAGNRYEIADLQALDTRSRRAVHATL